MKREQTKIQCRRNVFILETSVPGSARVSTRKKITRQTFREGLILRMSQSCLTTIRQSLLSLLVYLLCIIAQSIEVRLELNMRMTLNCECCIAEPPYRTINKETYYRELNICDPPCKGNYAFLVYRLNRYR